MCYSGGVVADKYWPRSLSVIAKIDIKECAKVDWLHASGPMIQLDELALEFGDLGLQRLQGVDACLG
jgi:hypothetical protein